MVDLRVIIEQLSVKYDNGDNCRHGHKVARLALDIFDHMSGCSNFTPEDRLLLEFSALLHDLGAFINDERHEYHSTYIILNDRLLSGLDTSLRLQLAIIAGSHRHSIRKQIHDLSSEEQSRLKKLIALLRVADALDYGRQDKLKIEKISCGQDFLHLSINVELSSRARVKLKEKSSLFHEQFEMTLECFTLKELLC